MAPEQMKSVSWGKGGGPAWAEGGRLYPGTPAGNEVQEFVAEMRLMQGRRQGCLHAPLLRCGRTAASNPACTLAFASSITPALQGAGKSSRSARGRGSGRSRSLPGCR